MEYRSMQRHMEAIITIMWCVLFLCSLVVQGYKKELVWNDIWKIQTRDSCQNIVSTFNRNWDNIVQKQQQQQQQTLVKVECLDNKPAGSHNK